MAPTAELTPPTFEAAAAALAAVAAEGGAVRVIGGGTKLDWGGPQQQPATTFRTTALDRTVEHNIGDLTAIFEAGVPVARAQTELAAAGQMLAIDPPLGTGDGLEATIGGLFATGDSGPVRHRYGQPRDLILGITVALGDGTIARAGGKVIKNVAGYDLAKLHTGAFGTLGVILSVSVRLHPLPLTRATAFGAASDPDRLTSAAIALARAPLELEALDVAWREGRGGLLAQVTGAEAIRRGERVAELMRDVGLQDVDVTGEDAALWARQRAGQRSATHALIRVAARRTALAGVLRAADAAGATLVGRAGLGMSYLTVAPGNLATLRADLPPGAVSILLDRPAGVDAGGDAWGVADGPAVALMRSVKSQFDPGAVCNPGVFVAGI